MKTEYHYHIQNDIKTVTVEPDGDRFRVTVGDKVYNVAAHTSHQGALRLEMEGQQWQAYVARHKSHHYVAIAGKTWVLECPQSQSHRRRLGVGGHTGSGCLEANMPGLVLDVCVAEGDTVERGQTLMLLEAMKMEVRISAPFAGQVSRVYCTSGKVVERGQVLVELEAE